MITILSIILAIACIAIIALAILCLTYHLKIKRIRENPSSETQLILAEMLNGGVTLYIERINPKDIFIRRE